MSTLGVVTVVLIVLKLAGVIGWSWWLVFAPLLVSIAINLLIDGLTVSISHSHKVTKRTVNEHEERPYWSNRGDE